MSATEANEERLALLEKKFSIDLNLTPQEVARLKELTTITDKAWPRYTESDHEILARAKQWNRSQFVGETHILSTHLAMHKILDDYPECGHE